MDLEEAIEELRDLAESPSITALSSASRVVLDELEQVAQRMAELEQLRERVAELESELGIRGEV